MTPSGDVDDRSAIPVRSVLDALADDLNTPAASPSCIALARAAEAFGRRSASQGERQSSWPRLQTTRSERAGDRRSSEATVDVARASTRSLAERSGGARGEELGRVRPSARRARRAGRRDQGQQGRRDDLGARSDERRRAAALSAGRRAALRRDLSREHRGAGRRRLRRRSARGLGRARRRRAGFRRALGAGA